MKLQDFFIHTPPYSPRGATEGVRRYSPEGDVLRYLESPQVLRKCRPSGACPWSPGRSPSRPSRKEAPTDLLKGNRRPGRPQRARIRREP